MTSRTVSLPTGFVARRQFRLRPELEAGEPPEARGLRRDGVRLLVGRRHDGSVNHAVFTELPRLLAAGDLLVVNTSGTVPAAVPGHGAARARDRIPSLLVHLGTPLPSGLWMVELRRAALAPAVPWASKPWTEGHPGLLVALPEGGEVELIAPYSPRPAAGMAAPPPSPPPVMPPRPRLWIADLRLPHPPPVYLASHGQPIRYAHVSRPWPLASYQTVFVGEPGSAEMPSAGRPFTAELVTRLVARGVGIAPLVLHAGVSSLESHEAPYPERFRVPVDTADRVNDTRRRGHRVVAVGTTVVRALETVADERGRVHPGQGWTDLVVTPEGGVRAVDGLVTGWHEPEASHLDLVEAVAGRPLIEASYSEALAGGYLWHEFGDSHLVLP
ncbi:MAG: S-adenosylmethionine:tRNA ribosyltransferase-isomerase [Acidimicrobiales bacterium]